MKRGTAAAAPGDFGPELRHRRGEVEVETAPDPDRPKRTIRRARIVDPLARMAACGQITPHHLAAAELLRTVAARTIAGGDSPLARCGMPPACCGTAGAWPSMAEMLAIRDLRRVMIALGGHAEVVRWAVLKGGTLDDFAKAKRRRRQAVARHFREAMDGLVEIFDAAADARRLTRDS